MLNRRRFLSGAAATTGAAVTAALVPGHAKAFSTETASAGVDRMWRQRCSLASDHAELVREARSALVAEGVTDPDRQRAALAAMTCPICGCRLAG